jgi:hypothetical protein
VFLVFLNSAGYILLFWKVQQDAKREMIQKIAGIIPANELTCIKIPKENITREEFRNKDEFEYKGSMYDVVKKEETKEFYLLYCLNDLKEDQLIKNFKNHFDNNREKSSHNNLRVNISFIAQAILKFNVTIKRQDPNSLTFISYLNLSYKSISPDNLTPPPKFFI